MQIIPILLAAEHYVVRTYRELFVLSRVDGIWRPFLSWVLTNVAAVNILVRGFASIGMHVGGGLRGFAWRNFVRFMLYVFGSPMWSLS